MRKPFWRAQTEHWYINLHGKQVRLSAESDPDGESRKTPPPDVETAWHKLMREGIPAEMRLADVFAKFKETCANAHHAKSTNFMLDQFLAHVGNEFKVSKLKPYHLSEFLKKKTTWGPASQRTCVNRILAAINFAVREGYIDKNPISSVPGYKRQGYYTKRKGVVDQALRQRLEEAARPPLRAILIGLRESGARPGELRKARIERCFLDHGIMLVPNKTARKTGQPERTLYLSEEMKRVLREQIGDRTEGFIFLTARGKPWSYDNLQERWRKLTVKVPVPDGISLYSYRRSFATAAINEKNINPALVAQLMGHVDLGMLLKHYAQEDPEALKRAIQALSGAEPPPASSP